MLSIPLIDVPLLFRWSHKFDGVEWVVNKLLPREIASSHFSKEMGTLCHETIGYWYSSISNPNPYHSLLFQFCSWNANIPIALCISVKDWDTSVKQQVTVDILLSQTLKP